LLCDPLTARPLVAIELDDQSHNRADRQLRDKFVDGVFAAAALPLVHVAVRPQYNVEKVRNFMKAKVEAAPVNETEPAEPVYPLCPDCNTPMILRTAKRGSKAGNQFWGCANYPQCKVTIAVES
jgi:hypothetical protein